MTSYGVTGGAGFIGSHIAERLLRDGHQVRIVDNLSTGRESNLQLLKQLFPTQLTFHQVSITDAAALPAIFGGVEVIYHQAALPSVPRSIENPLESHEQCATGTLNVLLAARDAGVRRVVYAASSAAYGDDSEDSGAPKSEQMLPKPISPYGVAKLMGEYYCQMFAEVYGLETVCLRYFNVFGPRQDLKSQYAAVIPLFMQAMLAGQPPTIYGDGMQSRDFTYIDNIVQANLLAADAPDASGEVMNVALGQSITLCDLVDQLNALLGTEIEPVHTAPRPGDIKQSVADISKAQSLLDYAPVVDFETGLARTLEYYRSELNVV
jgi:nucleoside-diphosphate-sugar epimerase